MPRKPHIVLFSGGTACRSITMALARRDAGLTRIVPAWDSGGSSKAIRERLGVLSIGDIRQALMTMAHGEGCSGEVVRLFNTRVSSQASADDAQREFRFYAEGHHPLLERMEPGLRGAILNYLKTFANAAGSDFDYRHGSIGNFILSGACLAHGGEINTAIFVFRKLIGIEGNVWPSSIDSDITLSATLKDGRVISPQDAVTKLSERDAEVGICGIELVREAGSTPVANPAVLEAIHSADLIAFGPGSFYTSILPHLSVEGIPAAVAANACSKLFLGNILQCRETLGMSLKDVASSFTDHWEAATGRVMPFVLQVLGNRTLLPFPKTSASFAYVADDLSATENVTVTTGELEDAWTRGRHDGDVVADMLLTAINR